MKMHSDEVARLQTPDEGALRACLDAMKASQTRDGPPDAALRMDRLTRVLVLLRDRVDAFCAALDADFGGRARETSLMSDVMATFNTVKYARGRVRRWMKPDRRDGVMPFNLFGARVEVERMPKGVVGILGPWNVPLFTTLAPLAFALAAGNRAMLKPSELVPRTSALLQTAVQDLFAAEEVAVFNGDAAVAGAFSALPFDHLVFTGSTTTGIRVMRAAAENLVPVTLELGGKSPVIVGRSADVALAAERIVSAKVMNSGQVCVSPDTVHVADELIEPFIAACEAVHRRLFPPSVGDAALTSVIDARHYARIRGYLEEVRSAGGRIVDCGGGLATGGRKMALHLVIGPPVGSRIAQEEIFGPLLQVERYADIAAIIDRINAAPRPLALYYFGTDRAEERRVLERTLSGGVAINDVMLQVAAHDAPFGGRASSRVTSRHFDHGRSSRVFISRSNRPYGLTCSQISGVRAA
ncbi:MAG: aldehyde dehydrogenase family protein [Thauera sp.]